MKKLTTLFIAAAIASPLSVPLVQQFASASPTVAHIQQGELKGRQIQPRELAAMFYEAGWQDAETLTVAVAVCLAESQGYQYAINQNSNGTYDRGIWQLNSIHTAWTDAVAYDPVRATAAAFSLYVNRGSSFEDWAAYNSGVYLRDSYLGRAVVGVANFLGERLLSYHVPPHADGTPYVHSFTTPIATYQFRVVQGLIANQRAAKALGWGAKPSSVVLATQKALAPGRTVVKRTIP